MAQSSEDRLKKIIADQLSVNEDDVAERHRSSTTSTPTRWTWSS